MLGVFITIMIFTDIGLGFNVAINTVQIQFENEFNNLKFQWFLYMEKFIFISKSIVKILTRIFLYKYSIHLE